MNGEKFLFMKTPEILKRFTKKSKDYGKWFICWFLGIRKPEVKTVNIDRFLEGHEAAYDCAKQELLNGHKESHWMWYIFPQIKGLGQSASSIYYAINDLYEARAYMNNDILRAHMLELCHILLDLNEDSINYIFSYPDDLKLQSCMTLFLECCPKYPEFKQVLDRYYNGAEDMKTVAIIEQMTNQEEFGVR